MKIQIKIKKDFWSGDGPALLRKEMLMNTTVGPRNPSPGLCHLLKEGWTNDDFRYFGGQRDSNLIVGDEIPEEWVPAGYCEHFRAHKGTGELISEGVSLRVFMIPEGKRAYVSAIKASGDVIITVED